MTSAPPPVTQAAQLEPVTHWMGLARLPVDRSGSNGFSDSIGCAEDRVAGIDGIRSGIRFSSRDGRLEFAERVLRHQV
jgi:hypothetical protein